ncbi:MAG: hypothetical protein SFU87_01245 [Chitinophagaceae bacterium]|nr:hypothetical protein [Chitinophagaceae bacterium]
MKYMAVAALLFSLFIMGCTSSHITSSWKAENIQPKNYNKIIVLALVREADRSLREKMEEHLAGDLKTLGYNAYCSCDEYNPKEFENMNEEQAMGKLRNSGVDAVLTIVLLNKTKERYYLPGRVQYSPYAIYYDRFWGYSRIMYDRIYSPGYYVTDTKYFWETNFYDLTSNQLLYSAQSQSFDPNSSETLGHHYGKMIIKDMVNKKLLLDSTGVSKTK